MARRTESQDDSATVPAERTPRPAGNRRLAGGSAVQPAVDDVGQDPAAAPGAERHTARPAEGHLR